MFPWWDASKGERDLEIVHSGKNTLKICPIFKEVHSSEVRNSKSELSRAKQNLATYLAAAANAASIQK
jgi:hypothetical protein